MIRGPAKNCAVFLVLALLEPCVAQELPPRLDIEPMHKLFARRPALSPDGKLIAYPHDNGTFRIRKVRTMELVCTLGKHHGQVGRVMFSPDSKLLISTCSGRDPGRFVGAGKARINEGGKLNLWDVEKQEVLVSFENISPGPNATAFSNDGKMLAMWSRKPEGVVLYDLARREKAGFVEMPSVVGISASFSADNKLLAVADEGQVSMVDLSAKKLTLKPLAAVPKCQMALFSPDGKWLAAGGYKGELRVWSTADLKPALEWEPNKPYGIIVGLGFTPNSKTLVVGGPGVHFIDLETKTEKYFLHTIGESISFSPDGKLLVTSGFDQIKLWDLTRLKFVPGDTPLRDKLPIVPWRAEPRSKDQKKQ